MRTPVNSLYRYIILCIAVSTTLTSCLTASYYGSPTYGSSMGYHTLPIQKDSVKSCIYYNGTLTGSWVNQGFRDNVVSVQQNLYKAHQFSVFKAWYGAGFTLGNYKVNNFEENNPFPITDTFRFSGLAGNKFFGSADLNAGIAVAVQLLKGGSEWRPLSVAISLQKEFGSYYHFRNNLIKDSVRIPGVTTSNEFLLLSFGTELVLKTTTGSFNIKQEISFPPLHNYIVNPVTGYSVNSYTYFTGTYALTSKKLTAYLQNSLGWRIFNIQAGVNYKINEKKK